MELPGLSVTFPELTIGMPKIRVRGASKLRQDARMYTEGGVAPFMQGAAAMGMGPLLGMVAGAPSQGDQGRGKKDDDEPRPKDEPRSKDCKCGRSHSPVQKADVGANGSVQERLRDLKSQVEQQNELLRQSMDELTELERRARQVDSNRRTPVSTYAPDDPPQPIPDTTGATRQIRLLPAVEEPIAPATLNRAAYWEPVAISRSVPRSPPIQRLPPVSAGSKGNTAVYK